MIKGNERSAKQRGRDRPIGKDETTRIPYARLVSPNLNIVLGLLRLQTFYGRFVKRRRNWANFYNLLVGQVIFGHLFGPGDVARGSTPRLSSPNISRLAEGDSRVGLLFTQRHGRLQGRTVLANVVRPSNRTWLVVDSYRRGVCHPKAAAETNF